MLLRVKWLENLIGNKFVHLKNRILQCSNVSVMFTQIFLKLAFYTILADLVGRTLRNYADHESLNHTTKCGLVDFSEKFSGIQDFREMKVSLSVPIILI